MANLQFSLQLTVSTFQMSEITNRNKEWNSYCTSAKAVIEDGFVTYIHHTCHFR